MHRFEVTPREGDPANPFDAYKNEILSRFWIHHQDIVSVFAALPRLTVSLSTSVSVTSDRIQYTSVLI
jgi:hypothetical protein